MKTNAESKPSTVGKFLSLLLALLLAVFLAGFLGLLLLACGGVRAGNPDTGSGRFAGVAGRVTSTQGAAEVPVARAIVEIGDRTATTDDRGYWQMAAVWLADEGDDSVTVRIRRQGFAPMVRVTSTREIAGAFLTDHMNPIAALKRISVKDGGTIVIPGVEGTRNDVAVRLPPNFAAFDAEQVDVALSVVRPENAAEMNNFPGVFVGQSADLPNGSDQIRTLGTVEVTFLEDGQALGDVTLNAPADMLLRLDPQYAAEFAEGAVIPTWWLDTNSGLWEGEGEARVVIQNGVKYASWSAKHFTWWNVDMPLSTHACVALRLTAAEESDRALLDELAFTVSGVDYAGTSLGDTFAGDGLAIVNGWRGHTVRPRLHFRNNSRNNVLASLITNAIFGSEATFAMPETEASAMFNVGPGGIPLEPQKHCRYLERTLQVPLGSLGGQVIDEYGDPLPGAIVAIGELGRTAVSNEDGKFLFTELPWSKDAPFKITVLAMPPASRKDLVFADLTVLRDQADQTVVLIAEPQPRPPVFTHVNVSNNSVSQGGIADFEVTVEDDNASISWGVELCGGWHGGISRTGEEDAGKVMICHYPPGNREKPVTISIGEAAVAAHLEHGDALGVCPGVDAETPPKLKDLPERKIDPGSLTCGGTLSGLDYSASTHADGRRLHHLRGQWNLGAGQGRQTLVLLAKDPLGYVSVHSTMIDVRNNAPMVVVDAPAYLDLGTSVLVKVRASDPDGDAMTYAWWLDGVVLGDTGTEVLLSNLAEGPHYLKVQVSDGDLTVTQQITVYVVLQEGPGPGTDGTATAPDTQLTLVPPSSTAATDATFAFASTSPNVAYFECRLDTEAYAVCVSPHTETNVAMGLHTFAVRAVNSDGVVDPTPAFATWEVVSGWETFSVGSVHTCAIKTGGQLSCWGELEKDVFGESDRPGFASPVSIGADAWRAVAAEFGAVLAASCGVRTDKTLWCWGDNDSNLLINGTAGVFYSTPVQIEAAADWQSVQLANNVACALNDGASLQCWGSNAQGRLGNGTLTSSYGAPSPVSGPAAWVDYAVGLYSSCGIASDQTLWCWGQNTNGELGLGHNTSPQLLPQRVNLEVDWVQVSVGGQHACAVKTGGSLWCWGNSANSELGIVGTASSNVPVQVSGTAWRQVSAGRQGTCATKTDGSLHCWGRQIDGEFGIGVRASVETSPRQVGAEVDWKTVAFTDANACGLKNTGDLHCTGNNVLTRIGNGLNSAAVEPVLVDDTRAWVGVTRLASHACGVEQGGELWCWGKNTQGEVGDGTVTMRQDFTRIAADKIWRATYTADEDMPSTSVGRSCAIETNGTMWCWGKDSLGGLGNGAAGNSLVPMLVEGDKLWGSAALGAYHSCALDVNGALYCWGGNSYGQAGVGNGVSSFQTPQAVGADTDWVQVKASRNESCARKSDNSLYCWGENYYGMHGRGNATQVTVPTATTLGVAWSDFDLGFDHACGVRTDGTLWCWGRNFMAQLGWPYDYYVASSSPLQVGSATDWKQVFLGSYYSCAIKTNGTLWCWGRGDTGALGIGHVLYYKVHTPTQVGTATDWAAVAPRWYDACGIRTNGDMYCWGTQQFGEWGNGSLYFATPQRVAPD